MKSIAPVGQATPGHCPGAGPGTPSPTEQSHVAPLKKLDMGFAGVAVLKLETADGMTQNRLPGLGLLIAFGL